MPLVDGVKMACAACIRGHRSTSCNHNDRPLLEVRKKGRPMSQCDHCRDLRKVKQVHVRCSCKPDESEAPKRKGKGKKAETEPELGLCNCDETGICICAVPRTTATRAGRRSSGPPLPVSLSPTTQTVPESSSSLPSDSSELSWPSCCLKNDPSSDTPSLKYGGAATGNTSGSESCCTAPPTPPDGSTSRLGNNPSAKHAHFYSGNNASSELARFNSGNNVHAELTHFNPEPPRLTIPPTFSLLNYSPMDDPLQFPLQTRSHRYTPYPQAIQASPTSHAGPSRISRNAQPIDPNLAFDSDTLALWDQFLREDTANPSELGNNASVTNITNLPNPFQDHSVPSSCSCSPASSCESCSPKDATYVPSASVAALISAPCTTPCTEFDCSTLAVAMALIDEDFPAVGENSSASVSAIQTTPQYQQPPFPLSASSKPDDLLSGLQHNPKAMLEQLGFQPELSSACTCNQKCGCFLCGADLSSILVSGGISGSCLDCTFCTNCRALDQTVAEMQKTSTQPIF